jgi:hypothetical protein
MTEAQASPNPPDHLPKPEWAKETTSLPIQLASVFNFQPSPDGIIVTFGYYGMPLVEGTPEEQKAEIHRQGIVLTPIARVLMSPGTAENFAEKLAESAKLSRAASARVAASKSEPVEHQAVSK